MTRRSYTKERLKYRKRRIATMDCLLFLAFLTTTLLFVAIPGPSVAFASAQAVKHGTRAAIITVAGDALGTVVHVVVAGGEFDGTHSNVSTCLTLLTNRRRGFHPFYGVFVFQRRPSEERNSDEDDWQGDLLGRFFCLRHKPKGDRVLCRPFSGLYLA